MGQLKEVHPEYADRVHVLAVDVDPSEKAEKILSYKESEGFPWPMTTADVQMLKEYHVTRQAAHMTLDANGVVVSGVSYRGETEESWRKLFENLVSS